MTKDIVRALVTGASGPIGAAICRRLARDGCEVIVHAHRNSDRAEAVTAEIIAGGGRAEIVRFDVTDAEAAATALEEQLAKGPIQILVSNASDHIDVPLAGMSHAQWHLPIDVSLHGFFNVVRPAILQMMRTRWGRIIAMSSMAGVIGNRGQANYAAAKAGLHGAVKSLSLEVASRGITVNAVAPGIIGTPDTETSFSPERIKSLVPMQRAGRPEEVADTVGFLASPEASYISGQIIAVNGGAC
ncbi:MAG: 3-oxoacyl-ACP reductase FabG [Rhodospirillales bacterium]